MLIKARVWRLKLAALEAFTRRVENEDTEIVRKALIKLMKDGHL